MCMVSNDWCLPVHLLGRLEEAAMVTTVHKEGLSATLSCSLVIKVRTDAARWQDQTVVSRTGPGLIAGCSGICPGLGELKAGIRLH